MFWFNRVYALQSLVLFKRKQLVDAMELGQLSRCCAVFVTKADSRCSSASSRQQWQQLYDLDNFMVGSRSSSVL